MATQSAGISLPWNRPIVTERTFVANRPVIVVELRSIKVARNDCDITVPQEENFVRAEKDKQIIYRDLAHEFDDIWVIV